jgi:hypothetical protein
VPPKLRLGPKHHNHQRQRRVLHLDLRSLGPTFHAGQHRFQNPACPKLKLVTRVEHIDVVIGGLRLEVGKFGDQALGDIILLKRRKLPIRRRKFADLSPHELPIGQKHDRRIANPHMNPPNHRLLVSIGRRNGLRFPRLDRSWREINPELARIDRRCSLLTSGLGSYKQRERGNQKARWEHVAFLLAT